MGEIVDAVFAVRCASLPVDHAWALWQAIDAAIPWLSDEPDAGLHTMFGADSGSGWKRPEGPGARIELSRRAKLAIRLPRHRLDAAAAALVGRTLEVEGSSLGVGAFSMRPLSRITTLFARRVALPGAEEEAAFLDAAAQAFAALDIRPERVLCGRASTVVTPARSWHTRSLMVAGIAIEESLRLQGSGLGVERRLGCGVFVPHKDIADLRSRED